MRTTSLPTAHESSVANGETRPRLPLISLFLRKANVERVSWWRFGALARFVTVVSTFISNARVGFAVNVLTMRTSSSS